MSIGGMIAWCKTFKPKETQNNFLFSWTFSQLTFINFNVPKYSCSSWCGDFPLYLVTLSPLGFPVTSTDSSLRYQYHPRTQVTPRIWNVSTTNKEKLKMNLAGHRFCFLDYSCIFTKTGEFDNCNFSLFILSFTLKEVNFTVSNWFTTSCTCCLLVLWRLINTFDVQTKNVNMGLLKLGLVDIFHVQLHTLRAHSQCAIVFAIFFLWCLASK